jgi:hypothetical protein
MGKMRRFGLEIYRTSDNFFFFWLTREGFLQLRPEIFFDNYSLGLLVGSCQAMQAVHIVQ